MILPSQHTVLLQIEDIKRGEGTNGNDVLVVVEGNEDLTRYRVDAPANQHKVGEIVKLHVRWTTDNRGPDGLELPPPSSFSARTLDSSPSRMAHAY